MSETDPRDELRALVTELRAALGWQLRAGAFAVPAGPTPRTAGAAGAAPGVGEAEAAAPASLSETSAGSLTVPRAAPVVGTPSIAAAAPGDEIEEASPRGRMTLPQVRDDLGECTRCKLHTTRTQIVFGVGAPDASLMFIGEAPGQEEDRRGKPFVGAAGQLLDKMIEAMGWTRDTVYIANVLKCRPPNNRDPEPDEIQQCQPFLMRQIMAVRPRVIVTLGRPATHLLLKTTAPMSALRGRFQEFQGIQVMPTFHPAFLLRSPDRKRDTWSDLKQVIATLDRLGVHSPQPPRG